MKLSMFDGVLAQVQPEYEDCRKAADSRGVPLKEVQAAALFALRADGGPATSKKGAPGKKAARKRAGQERSRS